MITHRVPTLSLIFGGILIASTMVSTNTVRAEWREIAVDKVVTANFPGMENWTPGYYQSTDEGSNRGVSYSSTWRNFNDRRGHALLTYQKRSRKFTYYKTNDAIRFFVKKEYGAEKLSIDDKINNYTSKLADFEFRNFSARIRGNTRKCVAFFSLRSGNRQFIYGHYCPSDNKPVANQLVETMIDSIKLDVDIAEAKTIKAHTSSTPEAQRDDMTATLLDGAAAGSILVVKKMLDRGVDVNVKSDFGVTALMFAASNGHLNTVELLWSSAADVNAKNNVGKTALSLTETALIFARLHDYHVEDYEEIVRLLREAGAKG